MAKPWWAGDDGEREGNLPEPLHSPPGGRLEPLKGAVNAKTGQAVSGLEQKYAPTGIKQEINAGYKDTGG